MKILSFLLFLTSFLFVLSSSFSLNVEQEVEEDIVVVQLLNGNYTLRVDGQVEIRNPTLTSSIYEFGYKVNPPAGIFGSFTVTDSNVESNYLGVSGFDLGPNSSIILNYRFSGAMNESFKEEFENSTSFLELFTTPRFIVKTSINVDKPTRTLESVRLNLTDVDYNSSLSPTSRAINSQIRNPTEFFLKVFDIEIYRTNINDTDVFITSGVVLKDKLDFIVNPFGKKEVGFYDEASFDGAIYWVKQSSSANWNWSNTIDFNYAIQQSGSSFSPAGSGGGSGGARDSDDDTLIVDDENSTLVVGDNLGFNSENLVIKKDVDKFYVSKGDEITVYLRVFNLGNTVLENISFEDEIPEGYELKSIDGARVDGNKLYFTLDKLDPFSDTTLEYTLEKITSKTTLTYFKPVEYDGNATLEGVLVVESLLGEGKLFVQKEVESIDDTFSKIKITIKNVGDGTLTNFKLIDEIADRYLLKDILKEFNENKRGEWLIPELAPGSEWAVEYLVETHDGMSEVPLLVGVEESDVYGTVIFDSKIAMEYRDTSSVIEKVGFGITILLVVIYLLF